MRIIGFVFLCSITGLLTACSLGDEISAEPEAVAPATETVAEYYKVVPELAEAAGTSNAMVHVVRLRVPVRRPLGYIFLRRVFDNISDVVS